jgi:hypothetical protein
MWKILQELIPLFLIILLLSQYIIPVIFNYQTWWLFKSSKKNIEKTENSEDMSLEKEVEKTKVIVDEIKEKVNKVKEKADENHKVAENLKKKTDNLI